MLISFNTIVGIGVIRSDFSTAILVICLPLSNKSFPDHYNKRYAIKFACVFQRVAVALLPQKALT